MRRGDVCRMKRLIFLIVLFMIGGVFAEEACFVNFDIQEGTDFKLIDVEGIFGNYEREVPAGPGVYRIFLYDADGEAYFYRLSSSSVLFFDDFSGEDGGSLVSDSAVNELVVPYRDFIWMEVFLGEQSWEFDLSSFDFICKKKCAGENEAIDFMGGEKCCNEFYPLYGGYSYICVGEDDYLRSFERGYSGRDFWIFGLVIGFLVLVFAWSWKR